MTQQFNRNYSNKLTIQRVHEYELDFAIEELEKRGYELVSRGVEEKDKKQFSHSNRLGGSVEIFSGSNVHRKCWARMKKIEVTV